MTTECDHNIKIHIEEKTEDIQRKIHKLTSIICKVEADVSGLAATIHFNLTKRIRELELYVQTNGMPRELISFIAKNYKEGDDD